jgi:EipB-like
MSRYGYVVLILASLAPNLAEAQMQPHRAEYVLRIGTAANAPRIGKAVQEVTLDCAGWHIKRDVKSEISLTSSLKFSLASKLDGEEARDGSAFSYHALQVQNGAEHDSDGKVRRDDGQTLAEISSPTGTEHLTLPPQTLMPIAAIEHLVKDLLAEETPASVPVFGAEGSGATYLVDVKQLDADSIRPLPSFIATVAVPSMKSWSVSMTFSHAQDQSHKALFSLRARIFDSGVLDRVTVDAGVAILTADLEALEMYKAPVCPRP